MKMTNKPKITLVEGEEEWTGLYIDGVLKEDTSSFSDSDILHILDELGILEYEHKFVNQEWLNDRGNLPKSIEDIVLSDYEKQRLTKK